jgi:hypothetical protein
VSGGAVYLATYGFGALTLGCGAVLDGNTAGSGGGAYVTAGAVRGVTVRGGARVLRNTASGGGGLFVASSSDMGTLRLEPGCEVSHNRARGSSAGAASSGGGGVVEGGGMYVEVLGSVPGGVYIAGRARGGGPGGRLSLRRGQRASARAQQTSASSAFAAQDIVQAIRRSRVTVASW